ncbi:hypothetical protein GCM10025772_11400 [Ferrimonas gelatinilytica]|uniref:Uncharacterized protein n=2 Tax=Ferrimonas gelatinilytica TaxID=1255257 RepID=A0ABP9S095_9GAMM
MTTPTIADETPSGDNYFKGICAAALGASEDHEAVEKIVPSVEDDLANDPEKSLAFGFGLGVAIGVLEASSALDARDLVKEWKCYFRIERDYWGEL